MRSLIIIVVILTTFIFPTLGQEKMSADLLFNQGNEAYNNDQYGDAMYYYEKALLLSPHDGDIQNNIQLTKDNLSVDIVELENFFLRRWWDGFMGIFLPGGWKILSILCFLGLVGFTYVHQLRNGKFSQNVSAFIYGLLIFLVLLFLIAGYSRSQNLFNNQHGILGEGTTYLYEGPDVVSEQIKEVTAGIKVRVLDRSGEWLKVGTLDKEEGWIKKDLVRMLSFEK